MDDDKTAKNDTAQDSPPVEPLTPDPALASPPTDVPDTAESNDEVDVPAAIERKTEDGPGPDFDSEKLPESDFDSYATDDVEETE